MLKYRTLTLTDKVTKEVYEYKETHEGVFTCRGGVWGPSLVFGNLDVLIEMALEKSEEWEVELG